MHSGASRSVNNRFKARSAAFLAALLAALIGAVLLSLRAGSYNTSVGELIRGLFGRAADNKINIIVRNNRLPRILTAIISGAGLARPAACCRRFCAIRWRARPRWAYRRARASAQRWRLSYSIWARRRWQGWRFR